MRNLIGVILCGGHSKRMGKEKYLIRYRQVPQYLYIENNFKQLKIPAYFSINESQTINKENIIIDNSDIRVDGPLKGIISAHLKFPEKDLFIVGCDYPNLTSYYMSNFTKEYNLLNKSIVGFLPDEQLYEPMVGIYTKSDLEKIKAFVDEGNSSLQQFCKKEMIHSIGYTNIDVLKSYNTIAEFKNFRNAFE